MTPFAFSDFAAITAKEVAPGFFSKLIHTEHNTINFIDVKAGNSIRRHQHIHEQYSFVLEGKFELIVEGVSCVLEPNKKFALIPSNAWHEGRALTDCKIVDVFSPVREDYRNL